jgi:hypothetical protein
MVVSPMVFFRGRRHVERSPQRQIIEHAAAAVKRCLIYACAGVRRGQGRTAADTGAGHRYLKNQALSQWHKDCLFKLFGKC